MRDILHDLKERGALIIIISVQPVDSLVKCEGELRSRLNGLAVVRLNPPDYKARIEILKRLVKNNGMNFSEGDEDKLAGMVLERLTYDMRKLTEGAISDLENYTKMLDNPLIDGKAIVEIFGEQITNPRLNMYLVQEVVARRFGMTVSDLKLRRAECPAPWTIAIYLCSTVLRASVQDIALTFGVDVPTVNATLRSIAKHSESFFEDIGTIHEELASL